MVRNTRLKEEGDGVFIAGEQGSNRSLEEEEEEEEQEVVEIEERRRRTSRTRQGRRSNGESIET